MKLIRWNPQSVSNRNLFDSIFDDFFTDRSFGSPLTVGSNNCNFVHPRADVSETDSEVNITFELPGLSKQDVQLTFENNVLTVKGEKQEEKNEAGEFVRRERVYGKFERSFSLPTGVDVEKVKAKFKDGVLQVSLPKKEEVKPREITIS